VGVAPSRCDATEVGIERYFFSSLPVKLRLKPSSEERGRRFEAQLHWE
jgi:hypothetical protein